MKTTRELAEGSRSTTVDSPAATPGKQTLTMAIQRRAQADETAARPAEPNASAGSAGLPVPVQRKMENAFDFNFSQVRVHEGPQAQAMGAVAYTEGTNLHFAPGEYQPGSERGHERP